MARNQEFADPATKLADGDEVAFLPPVSGGRNNNDLEIREAGHYFALTRHAIDTHAVIARLLTGAEGAVVTFEGTVRNHTKGRATRYLDYECYEAMAIRKIAEIGREIAASTNWSALQWCIAWGGWRSAKPAWRRDRHAPAPASPPSTPRYDGINRLKKLVPIWKKEHFADGEVWVEGEWDDSAPAGCQV